MKTKHIRYLVIMAVALSLAFAHGCYYDNEEKLYPEISTNCDTVNVNYSGTVQTILQASCYSCHSNSNGLSLGGGIRFEDYSDLVNLITNGRLMGSIRHESGYSPMPQGGGMLSNCEISQMEAWINNGAINN